MQKKTQFSSAYVFSNKGFSFVELIITVAIFALVFGGLFAAFQSMIILISNSKAKAGALALMSSKMEYIRSLPYNDIGTIGGVPSGPIAQTSTTTINNIKYNERVLIQYVDDPADGIGAADSNAILADYKQVKVEYTWNVRGKLKKAALVSNIVPVGIESTAGGGTIRVNVFDADANPVDAAEVRFVNNTTTTTIDTLRYTDSSGIAYLSAAPAAANYEITVTKSGYSTDKTYTATTSNPNPVTPPAAVLESQISTMNFQIDELSNLLIRTIGPATYDTFTDTFTDSSLIATTSSTTIGAGAMVLTGTGGIYATSGTVQATSTSPATIDSWYSFSFDASTTASTSVKVSLLYNNGGVMMLVPDADLPGNSVGFVNSPINITYLNPATYNELALKATLDTLDTTESPELHQWGLKYITNQPTIANVDLSMQGAKVIGTDASSKPIYKFKETGTTNASGQWSHNNIEWDTYTVEVASTGYSVYEVCPSSPYMLNPAASTTMDITIDTPATHLLRVIVTDTTNNPIADATVRLQNIGVDELSSTSLCGQTYFSDGSLYDDDDYLLTVSAPGYTTQSLASTTVSSSSTVTVILN